ncbi:hypothetical protein [Klebsiella pneumoniae IS46]|uniref:Uncharacterized protein n=1 Tax=Klebsiella pneumoniae 30684/NJST258_2 TaxID=1420013 RepID=W8VD35_KLEPN|nr:hypothetical protein KPNJ2_00301 [Klebsiella pneumoniae 30684/NJST258_2]AHM82705.1 hypothetical protein KPNJ1_00299 [Klebsiella pneumoniae 30660/NJST258_1]AWZ72808.1 hypothetical protein CSB99_0586 [Klebsiella pneumoniae]EOY70638.1 hypothetical protein H207_1852 [Klebsiella pneumoniae UHKPC40]EOY82748.1 hypothetical protein H232_2007 [Klebsiella pneumoniae UHKPC81]EPB13014.1 hypothetical protein H234_1497 [Klebsiella pneumoniae UHKPC 52]EPS04915.1 hypothetical protein UKKV901664_47240 [Kle
MRAGKGEQACGIFPCEQELIAAGKDYITLLLIGSKVT